MTPSEKTKTWDAMEIKAQLMEMAKVIGVSTYNIHCSITTEPDREPIHAAAYPYGYGDSSKSVRGDYRTFEDLFLGFPLKYREWRNANSAEMIGKIALEIIRLTDLNGECKESDLRMMKGVSQVDLADLAEAACAKANEMAGKGPFTIEKGAKGNAP